MNIFSKTFFIAVSACCLSSSYAAHSVNVQEFYCGKKFFNLKNTEKNNFESTLGIFGFFSSANIFKNYSNYEVKTRYSFGIAPRIGYNFFDSNVWGYLNVGMVLNKFQLLDPEKNYINKTSIFLGLGIEKKFGSAFIKGECSKLFKINTSPKQYSHLKPNSYVFKVGGGYRF